MKKYLLIALFIISGFTSIYAQDDPKREERIQALKIAFITQKLELTADEAQKFWPVYNQYEGEIRQAMVDNKGGDVLDNEERVLNIRKHYKAEFIKVLGQPKMNRLFAAERDFRGVLIRNLKNRQGQRPFNQRK